MHNSLCGLVKLIYVFYWVAKPFLWRDFCSLVVIFIFEKTWMVGHPPFFTRTRDDDDFVKIYGQESEISSEVAHYVPWT